MILTILVENILPIFLVVLIGFLVYRTTDLDPRTLSRVTLQVFIPCLVFTALVTADMGAAEFGQLVLFTCAVLGGLGLLGWLAAVLLRLDRGRRSAFILGMTFANAGNLGLPVVLYSFGPDALTRATIIFIIMAILNNTIGAMLASSGRVGWREGFTGGIGLPLLLGLGGALVVRGFGWTVPEPLLIPLNGLGSATIWVSLLLLGMQIRRIPRAEIRLVSIATALRTVAGPLLGWGTAVALGLSGPAFQAGLLQSAMPLAVNSATLAVEFDSHPAFVTGVTMLTTLISPLSLSLMIFLLS